MRMIPDAPHHTGSPAEKRVFDRLRLAFADVGEDYLAYHSLRPTRHPVKRFPEADFLIVGPEGLYVLEVKGGAVSHEAGVWRYRDRHGVVGQSREGPFRQAESALHGVLADLRARLPDDVLGQFHRGYGVVMPDCTFPAVGLEWDPALLADCHAFRDLEGWLRALFRHWRQRDSRFRRADPAARAALAACLSPTVTGQVPLLAESLTVEERVMDLTRDQQQLVAVLAANPRVICEGGAGTGKTFLALELARRWSADGCRVGLVCRSPWLRRYLAVQVARWASPSLLVATVAGLASACRRAGVAQLDGLIVDEGQDLLASSVLATLDGLLAGGLANGRWCWFQDSNNQSGLLGECDPAAQAWLAGLAPTRVPLTVNCRNSLPILTRVQQDLGADMGVRGAGAGPAVRLWREASRAAATARLWAEIRALVEEGGLAPGAVTVLSPHGLTASCAAGLDLAVLDEYAVAAPPGDRVGFARIDEFKGLESEAVIVVDLPVPRRGGGSLALHYVAMSRARAVLSVIYLDD